MKTKIITIGRQFGAGGIEIGRVLAEKLGIPFYDKELIAEAAQKSGLSESFVSAHDEVPTSGLIYSFAMNLYGIGGKPVELLAYEAQVASVRNVAEKGSCVIVGRAADYILKDEYDVISVFVTAPFERRVKHIMARDGLNEKEAERKIERMDKQRAAFYNSISDSKWGMAASYDLCIDSSKITHETAADIIRFFFDSPSRNA